MDYNQILEKISQQAPNIILSIFILLIFWILGKFSQNLIKKIFNDKNSNNNISKVLSNIPKKVSIKLQS